MHTASRSHQPTRSPGGARFAQLERLRRMIEAGTYQVDLDALASRLVEDGFGSPLR